MPHSHKVRLVGIDGQEQSVIFEIETEGVHLLSQKAQHLERFPFEVIVKWLPSTLRTQNPGSADCFDIQLKTAKGPRELRVKADSEKQAKKILKQLEATVQALVDKRRALAAKQQNGAQRGGVPSLKVQPGQQADSGALQHAAPSDMFSVQPSMLVSAPETLQKQSAAPMQVSHSAADIACIASSASFSQSQSIPLKADSMPQGKSPKSPLGKTDPSRNINSQHKSTTLSGQQQSLSAISQAADAPVTLATAHSTLAASSRQLQPPLPTNLAAFDKQASLQPSTSASHQASASLTLPPTRQSGSASSAAQADGLSVKQSSLAAARAEQLNGSGSAISPRQRRDPSPAELALTKQESLAAGVAAPDAHAFVLSPGKTKDPSSAEPRLMQHQSGASKGNPMSMGDPNIEQSAGSQSSIAGVITPRGRRDPSPAELGLLKARSIEPLEGPDMSNSQTRDHSFAGSSKQRRDSSPARLAFSHQLPVSSQGGMLGQDQDQEEDTPRLKSFTGPSAAGDPSSKAFKKRSKQDSSALSRMGSSLLRPFKGLSKLRTSRSSDKDGGRLQGQSQAASHTEGLASRAPSNPTSAQDAAGPFFNSASLQNPTRTLQGAKSALEPSPDSFQFRRTATDDAPDLAAEPSFAQDLPKNSRTSRDLMAGGTSRVQAPLLSSGATLLTASAGSVRPGQSLSNNEPQRKVSGAAAAAATPTAAGDSDDEFEYDFSQPAAAQQRSTAVPSTAALLQPKVVSTSSLQGASSKADAAGSSVQAQHMPDSITADSSTQPQTAGTAPLQGLAGFSLEPGRFRPQRSRAEKPQLGAAGASVYSPLGSGAATSPTMRGSIHEGDGRKDTQRIAPKDHIELVSQEGQPPEAEVEQASSAQQAEREGVQNGRDQADIQAQPQAAKDSQRLAGGVLRQGGDNRNAQGRPDRQDGPHDADHSGSHRGSSVHGALTGHGFLDDDDDSSSPGLSSASSAASIEFDNLEALPNQSPQLHQPPSTSLPASPLQPPAEHHTVQRSAYSDTPILGPSTARSGHAETAASAGVHSSTAMHRGLLGDGAQQAQSQASALPLSPSPGLLAGAGVLPATPRRGFSDKPILAVYSRRPSADEEATVAKDSGSQMSASAPPLQTKVHMLEEVVRQLSHDLSVAEKAVASSQAQTQADADSALRALPAAEREVKALNARVAELGGENEQLRWELKSAQQKQQQAEQRLQQQDQSDKLAPPSQSSQADTSRLRGDLEALSRQNSELSSELAAACQSLKAEQALVLQKQREHQQHQDNAERASWELQHQVDNLTQENQSLIAHHEQLETKFKFLTKQLAKAQHAQHAGAQSKADQADTLARACDLQEQVNSLLESSAVQVEQRHRLENEVATLQRRLGSAESALSQHQHKVRGHQAAESASNGKVAMLQQQAESVVEENVALQAQCRQSAADMKQLQNDVQARSAEVVSLSREVAELMERTEAAEAAADRYEAKHRTSKAELQQAQASCAQQSSEIEQLSEALAHEQAAAGSSQDAVEQLSSKLSAVQGEIAALTAQQQQLTASESASRQQLAASVQAHEQATAACASAEAELHRLSAVLEDSDAQLVLAHQKEAQVCACIRTAMDAAQDAAAARDRLLDQQAESEAELRALRAKSTRQAAAVAAAADAEERVMAAEAKSKAAHADLSSWQSQVAELKAERDRLLNDKASLHSQIAELREHYASLGLASGHLGSHRASQGADSARSEALTRLQDAQLSHERATREWEVERQQLQVAISDQRKRMAEVESTAISHRAEAASMYRQADSAKQEAASVRQELAGSRDSHRAAEAELRGEVIGLRAEADAAIEALRMQLTAVTSKLKRYRDETGRSSSSQQSQLAQAQQALATLQHTADCQNREAEESRSRALEVQADLQALHADHARLSEQFECAQTCNASLRHDLKACKRSLKQVSAHVQALEQKEDMLLQANRDLNLQLDRAELEVTRADRQRQTALDRCSSLQKQCHSLQDMSAMQISAQVESKMHVHGVQRAKRSREDRIQAHMPVQGIM